VFFCVLGHNSTVSYNSVKIGKQLKKSLNFQMINTIRQQFFEMRNTSKIQSRKYHINKWQASRSEYLSRIWTLLLCAFKSNIRWYFLINRMVSLCCIVLFYSYSLFSIMLFKCTMTNKNLSKQAKQNKRSHFSTVNWL
jgi:hypothetical protein